jgi:hypothetical protein
MPEYREKLWASPAPYVATALIIPASILVFAPISMLAGVLIAAGLYAACVLGLLLSAPVVRIPLTDPTDPSPYWLVSSRRPQKMAAAINGSRRPTSSN